MNVDNAISLKQGFQFGLHPGDFAKDLLQTCLTNRSNPTSQFLHSRKGAALNVHCAVRSETIPKANSLLCLGPRQAKKELDY